MISLQCNYLRYNDKNIIKIGVEVWRIISPNLMSVLSGVAFHKLVQNTVDYKNIYLCVTSIYLFNTW